MKLISKDISFMSIVILKLIFSILFIFHLKDENSYCFVEEPNTEIGTEEGYLSSIENLLENGEYYYDGIFANGKMYAPRVPGVSLSYLLFRFFFPKIIALNCLIIFQSLIFLVSLFFFSKTLLKSDSEIYKSMIFTFLFGLDTYLSFYNHIPFLGESFSTSITLFSLYFLYRLQSDLKNRHILNFGIFIALSFFFRVPNIVLILSSIIIFIYLLVSLKTPVKKALFKFLILIAPFILMESTWIVRNYIKTDRFIPFQEIVGASDINIMNQRKDIYKSCVNFCKSFGGDWIQWNPKSTMAWFYTDKYLKNMNFKRPGIEVFPRHIQENPKMLEELTKARTYWFMSLDSSKTKYKREIYIENAVTIFDALKRDIYENHSFLYHIGSRFKTSYNLLFGSSTYYIPYSFDNASFIEKIIKINSRIIYYIVMIIPLLFFPFYIFKYKFWKNYLIDFSYISFFGFISMFGFLFRATEFRQNHLMYLFCMVISINALNKLLDNQWVKKHLPFT